MSCDKHTLKTQQIKHAFPKDNTVAYTQCRKHLSSDKSDVSYKKKGKLRNKSPGSLDLQECVSWLRPSIPSILILTTNIIHISL